ncbi:fluoride efflux transporter CrcB [Robertkochia solimangrovi]|uniref:fluoride efflux transporter CrcB n=1 Tax=Robertkochia solimangrovi TaxID=2213046 RepID=UPI0011801E99|nr:fluoride efflux transporter CrcB [Robertkochia solimangrovi]TRZ43729.1 fluoride efflux transporter CrcB [Robertkochia solimangrovi]
MKQVLLVFIGGGVGSAMRYLIGRWLNPLFESFPLGTFLANIIGCFIIGFTLELVVKGDHLTHRQLLLIATGFCGGFTTFSTFSLENFLFLKNGDYLHFLVYSISTFAIGLTAVLVGASSAKLF